MQSGLVGTMVGMSAYAFAAFALTSVLYSLIVVAASVAVCRRKSPVVSRPPASVLVPLCGVAPALRGNLDALRAALRPGDELLVGSARPGDPAIGLAREVLGNDPRARIVVGSGSQATNPKVATLVALERLVTREVVVLVDSDVRLSRALLDGLIAPLADPRTGLATALYRGVPSGSVASRLEALSINVDFVPSVLVSHWLHGRIDFALGAANAVRREALRAIGGIASLGEVLADDHILGRKVARAGYRVTIAPVCVPIWLDSPLRTTLARLLRWSRTYRACRPSGYAGTFLSHHGVTSAMAALGLAIPGGAVAVGPAVLLLASVLVVRTTTGLVAHVLVAGQDADFRSMPLLVVRDLVGSALFIGAWSGRGVTWGNVRYRVAPDGTLHRRATGLAREADATHPGTSTRPARTGVRA
jgi:ceramide glucosyltransferase